ncbi:MAG: hypothetical protein ABFE01_27900 [Phycisphaerales bacterium]|jgi:hypothetical protein
MNGNAQNGREGLSADWVKEQLRMISSIEPPRSLRDRLEAGIPARTVFGPAIRWSWRVWGAGAAAAVIVAASTVVWLGTPWGRQIRSAIDANSGVGRVCATDHNSLRLSDTNLCDINSLR